MESTWEHEKETTLAILLDPRKEKLWVHPDRRMPRKWNIDSLVEPYQRFSR
jgi:hypothetical protein